ncbi:uncharacterized protein J4E92_010088 [Alternaria infectoria]|uniref:uncharacterized protein n=1 Tax=Alternaria infectoria TaxID=45303 RepID=UPI0022204809|nr:uncharacterized protein J4E92_010088 [Alternaria infectoria]KAI4912237.1 hypothetical protein J4E92_010088 [Alternaria infectoria]
MLLSFQIICVVSDIVFFRKKVYISPEHYEKQPRRHQPNANDTSWVSKAKRFLDKPDISRSVVPLLSTVLSVIITSAIFSGMSETYRSTVNACSTNLDADISGVGVRVSIWLQIGMLLLISIYGHFHKRDTGIKEVGGGLILTHVALTIALVVQMYKGTLTSVDAAIGAVILDAQNVALHIPSTAKQTLAARWQVLLLIPAQIMGLVFLPVLVTKFIKGGFASEDCQCLDLFWWSRLSDCDAFSGNEISLFWIYYTLRCIMWVQSSFHSMYNTQPFHKSEKNGRDPILRSDHTKPKSDSAEALALEFEDTERGVKRATVQYGPLYKQYPATILLSYTTYALYSLTSMVVAEVTIREYDLQPSSNVYSIGQIIAIVVSLATLIRAIWSFQSLYIDSEDKSFPDLVFEVLTWPPWRCCFEPDEDTAATSSKQDEKEPRKEPGADSGGDGSGRQDPPQHPAPPLPSGFEAAGQPEQYSQPYPGSPHPANSRPSSDSTNLSKPQPYSPLQEDGRAQRPQPDQLESQPRRSHSHKPAFRLKFRQPFHLDAVKQLFFPAFTQYLEERKEEKAAVPRNENPVEPPFEPPAFDQHPAYTWPGHSQGNAAKEKAPVPLSVEERPHLAETLGSADSELRVLTSGKPSDSISGNMNPGTDSSDVTDQPGKDQALEGLQPKPATRQDMGSSSILARPGPEEDQPIGTRKSEERQLAALRFPIQTPEEELLEFSKADAATKSLEPVISYQGLDERQGVQYGVPQNDGSAHTEEKSPLPLSIFGPWRDSTDPIPSTSNFTDVDLESKIENPGIADQSEGGKGPQEPEARSETGRASIRSVDPIDTESDTEDQKTEDHSTTALDSGGSELDSAHLSPIVTEEDLPERSKRHQLARQRDRIPSDLRVNSPREVSTDDLKRDPHTAHSLFTAEFRKRRLKKQEESGKPGPRSGCPGNMGKCEQSETVWENYSSFLHHCHTHQGQIGQFDTGKCYECAKSSTSSNPGPRFVRSTELARHIWDNHLHKVDRDPSSPSLAEAEQGKGKSAEASELERSEPIDDGSVDPGTVIDRSVF